MRRLDERSRCSLAGASLFVGIVASGFGARGVGLDTASFGVALAVVAVGVFLGAVLRKLVAKR